MSQTQETAGCAVLQASGFRYGYDYHMSRVVLHPVWCRASFIGFWCGDNRLSQRDGWCWMHHLRTNHMSQIDVQELNAPLRWHRRNGDLRSDAAARPKSRKLISHPSHSPPPKAVCSPHSHAGIPRARHRISSLRTCSFCSSFLTAALSEV